MDNNNQYLQTDAFGNRFKVGDIILIAKNSDMQPAYVLGWTARSLIVSCKRKVMTYSNVINSTYVARTRDVKEHDSMQRIASWYSGCNGNMYIMSSGNIIPEHLQKFVKMNQV